MKKVLLALCALTSLHAQVTEEDLLHGPDQNWLTYVGDYFGQRNSPLKQITTVNVNRLVAKWVHHLPDTGELETVPLVFNGVMYATGSNSVYALDAVTGKEIWHYQPQGTHRRASNRGAAILGNRIYFTTGDCHLIALERNSGAAFWEHDFSDHNKAYSCTGAPLVVKDKIIVGLASSGKACYVAALSAETGEEAWRVWAVPHPGEPGAETWGKLSLDWAGGPTWTTGTFDPQLNLVYWATGNPWPDFDGSSRPGDNLFTDSILAINPDTGKVKWHFQFVPHDTHDWDANETPVLYDGEFRGKPRKLLLQANRNGFYYVLDRETGQFLHGVPFVKELNWASGLDDSGRPLVVKNTDPSPGGVRVCPSVHGATNWWAPSLNPDEGLFFVVALEECEIYYSSEQQPVPNGGYRGTGHTSIPSEPGSFYLRALDITTGKLRWERRMPGPTTMWAGTVATAGGLVFSADDDGDLVAFDQKTGKDLWHFYMGSSLKGSPMTFSVARRQYVTVAAGTDLFTFGLMGPSDE